MGRWRTPTAPTYRVTALDELDEAALGAWAELAGAALEPNPFLHPDFVLAAARAQTALADVHVVATTGGGGWSSCLAVRASRSWRRLPIPGTLTWLHDQCFLGTPLVSAESPERSLAALLRGLRESAPGAFAELDMTDASGPVGESLHGALPRGSIPFGGFARPSLIRRPQPDYLGRRMSGKHRRSLRRLTGQLAERLGGELELVDRAGEDAAVSDFIALEAAGWKGERSTALGSLASREAFFRSVCHSFAARGELALLFLQAGGQTIAARCNLRAGDVIFCFKIAYDERLRHFSPGVQLELAMVEHFHSDASAQRMDSCVGPGSELFRIWPDLRRLEGVLLPGRGVGGRAVTPALRAGAAAVTRHRRSVYGYEAEASPAREEGAVTSADCGR